MKLEIKRVGQEEWEATLGEVSETGPTFQAAYMNVVRDVLERTHIFLVQDFGHPLTWPKEDIPEEITLANQIDALVEDLNKRLRRA